MATYTIDYKIGYRIDNYGTDPNVPFTLGYYSIPVFYIVTTSVPNVCTYATYSQTLVASGGITPYTWEVTSGSLPTGIYLNSATGELSGSCGTTGTYNFTVTASDSTSPAPYTDSVALTIVVSGAVFTGDSAFELLLGQGRTIVLSTSLGQTDVTWYVLLGQLPDGMSLYYDSVGLLSWVISGTPTMAGEFQVDLDLLTNSSGCVGTIHFYFKVWGPPEIVTTSLPAGTKNVYYSTFISAQGGKPFFTATGNSYYLWGTMSGFQGNVPPGLALDSMTGELSGIPTQSGPYSFTVIVTDSNTLTDSQAFTVIINDPGGGGGDENPGGGPDNGGPEGDSQSYLRTRLASVKSVPVIVQDDFHQKYMIDYIPSTLKRE
jgi:hypothetical protein